MLERRIVTSDLRDIRPASKRTALLGGDAFDSYYAVPLIAKGQMLGVLEIFHRSALQPAPEWLEFLEALAGQAAIAIDNARLFDSLQDTNQELVTAYDATIEGWSRALDLRDHETEGHSQRVTELTTQLALAMGMNAPALVRVRSHMAAWLHFLGNLTAVALSAISWFLRARDMVGAVLPTGFALLLVVAAILTATGWLGGELVFRHKIGVVPRNKGG